MMDSVYQTTELHNKSDTPVYFKFSPEITRAFKVFPNQGLIVGKSFQLLVVEFVPKEIRAYQQTLSCHLNHQMSNQIHLQCYGYCSSPSLELQNEGKIFFPPSFTGVYSRQKVYIQIKHRSWFITNQESRSSMMSPYRTSIVPSCTWRYVKLIYLSLPTVASSPMKLSSWIAPSSPTRRRSTESRYHSEPRRCWILNRS